MFFGNIAQLEVTKDKEFANKLLNDGWLLLKVHEAVTDDFIFVLGRGDYPRRTIVDGLRDVVSAARKAV